MRKSGRNQALMVAAVFGVPLLLATWMYYGGVGTSSRPGSQHGILLEPILHLPDVLEQPDVVQLSGHKWLLAYTDGEECLDSCRIALYKLRQVRLMLGNDMNRVERLFLHGESVPDKVFLQQQHAGLISIKDQGLSALLDGKKPPEAAAGGHYLVDPLGNLVMYFPPEIVPREMLGDIKHLLELSRIG
jgi:hypothetical protein